MKNENYIVIQGWMINELGLKGNELLVYAIIYGFSQDEINTFNGSSKYICDSLGLSKPTVLKILSDLTYKNLLLKTEKVIQNVTFCEYAVNLTSGKETLLGVVKKFNWGGKETLLGGGKETLPNNTNFNKKENKLDNNKKADSKKSELILKVFSDFYSQCNQRIPTESPKVASEQLFNKISIVTQSEDFKSVESSFLAFLTEMKNQKNWYFQNQFSINQINKKFDVILGSLKNFNATKKDAKVNWQNVFNS